MGGGAGFFFALHFDGFGCTRHQTKGAKAQGKGGASFKAARLRTLLE
jgi:hypothetical protein